MRNLILALILASCLGLSGCSTKVHDDYAQYLRNNTGQAALPRVDRPFGYSVSPATENHSVTIRSWRAGIANTWDVRFNDMLRATLDSADIRNAISLHPALAEDTDTVYFDLESYVFADSRAMIRLRIATALADGRTLDKVYYGDGRGQAGKIFWGGFFAMKNAVQQSSKLAMDQIFSAYFLDLLAALRTEEQEP